MARFEGKTYLVTGAGSGIGRQVALTLSEQGATVILVDINEDSLKNTSAQCTNECPYLVIDLSDSKEIKQKIEGFCTANGKLNGFVHCAGLSYVAPLKNISPEKAEKVWRVNTQAAIELAKVCSSGSIKALPASFVLISSVYGIVGSAANAAYAASKGAIIALTKALSMELASKGIRVNCVAPGFVKTDMMDQVSSSFDSSYVKTLENLHPLGLGSASAIADPIAFLLSEEARWITGTVLSVDGGFTAK